MSIKCFNKSQNIFIKSIDNINKIDYNINVKVDNIKNIFYEGVLKMIIKKMNKEELKSNLILIDELSVAEENLSNDIQALAYIQDELTETKNKWLDIELIRNAVETLLKSMIYNKNNMKNVLKTLDNK